MNVRKSRKSNPPLTPKQREWLEQGGLRLPYPLAEALPLSKSHALAVKGMMDEKFITGRKYEDQQFRVDVSGGHPELFGGWLPYVADEGGVPTLKFKECRGFFPVLRSRMETLKVPMFVNEGLRSNERQAELKAGGFSKAGPGSSAHNYFCAGDYIHGVRGWELDKTQWAVIGHIGHEVAKSLQIEVVWGGDDGPGDKFNWDPAHWEIKNWRVIRGAFQSNPQITSVHEALKAIAEEQLALR